jgi:hypothetical protein
MTSAVLISAFALARLQLSGELRVGPERLIKPSGGNLARRSKAPRSVHLRGALEEPHVTPDREQLCEVRL